MTDGQLVAGADSRPWKLTDSSQSSRAIPNGTPLSGWVFRAVTSNLVQVLSLRVPVLPAPRN